MLFSNQHYKKCEQYLSRLERELPARTEDPEYTGVARPTNSVFRQMEIVAKTLCDLGNHSVISTLFAVTPEGSMELVFPGYERAWIRLENGGIRMFNAQAQQEKFLPGVHSETELTVEFKKFMKPYL